MIKDLKAILRLKEEDLKKDNDYYTFPFSSVVI